jgi:hypothetical protein
VPPRYFTVRPSSAPKPAPGHPVTHALDVFVLEGPHQAATEWVVGFDDLGQIAAQPFAGATGSVRGQVSFHEVAGGTRRQLRAAELYLFEVQLMEQAADRPGFDDPVHLYGTMLGPLSPAGLGEVSEGQLTVTRADILEGAARGASHAFRHAAPGGAAGARGFQLLLPGDRPEELSQGRGVVIAYPVLAADLQSSAPGNEFFFNQILYDVITGVWGDVEREAPPPRRRPEDVPVPNRALAEQLLVNQGYVIEGDSAVRPRKGLLGSVLGAFVEDRRTVPREGSSDDYLRLADEALAAVGGWPAARARALRSCLGGGGVSPPLPRFEPAPAPMPAGLPAPPPPPRQRAGPPHWMVDFIASHQPPGARPPVVTGAGKPDWMNDFAPEAGEDKPATEQDTRDRARPDWMKDFES